MSTFQTEQFLNDLLFQASYEHGVIWECRQYLVIRGFPLETMEDMAIQDKLFALSIALVRRYNFNVKGRSIENLKNLFDKVINALEEIYEGEINLIAFGETPFVELTPLADELPDPSDYWKNN